MTLRTTTGRTGLYRDTELFLEVLRNLALHPAEAARDLFAGEEPVFVARAPGRLDVMGGIADYSGSLVLQLPLLVATHAAVQRSRNAEATVVSPTAEGVLRSRCVSVSLEELCADGSDEGYRTVSRTLNRSPEDAWAAYVLGTISVLIGDKRVEPQGMHILIGSDVPESRGVSSSAALEVATMNALCAALDLPLDPCELAVACQKVENLIANAPCGIMDQLASHCGQAEHLLPILCQPHELWKPVRIPEPLRICAIDSGIRHAVSGTDYGSVRAATFMGYRILAAALQFPIRQQGETVAVEDPHWNGYLANLTPEEFDQHQDKIPEVIEGAEFLQRFGGIPDRVTRVDPQRKYPVKKALAHPIQENDAVARFHWLLQRAAAEQYAEQLGALMYDSHSRYALLGLGSDGTDALVQIVEELGPEQGFYGARITGGGSGGSVAILCDRTARLETVMACYQEQTGRSAQLLQGSSDGAWLHGVLKLGCDLEI